MRPWPALNICLFATVVASGCRWSHQSYPSAYEGEVRFEHCYRLDEECTQPQEIRRQCWQDWIRSYTYGQSRDRIDYATTREQALARAQANGESAPPASTTVDPARTRGEASPAPTSAFAPPPRTLPQDAGADAPGAPAASNDALHRLAPGTLCASSCSARWLECGLGCKATDCQSTCDSRYKSCMRKCF
jgi:hypothetical protein